MSGAKDTRSEALEERAERLRALLDTAYDGVVVTQDGVVVEVTQGLLDTSGYTHDEVIGKPVTEFIADDFRDAVRERQRDGAEGRFESAVVLKDGRRLDIEVVARNHVIGGRTSRVAALRDVTDKRRLEQQLRQAQKLEALGRFAAGIAHDFNNILTIVRSYADILLQEVPERHRADALEILKAADAGAGLTRQLLAYSRQQLPRLELIDLNEIVLATEGMLRRIAGSRIELVLELADDLRAVNADMSQLQQVILNLAMNARDAMPHGGVIAITTSNLDVDAKHAGDHLPSRPGRYVRFAVKDSGSGMSEDVKAQIFEPFFTTKAAGRGTGLGLPLVRGIVEHYRGFIIVDSTMNVGSTFAVYLPAV